jgi:hypothetical protein
MDTAVIATEALALSSLGIGVILTKSFSLELSSMLQVSYLSLSTVNNLDPIQSTLYNFKYMNGYNNMMENIGTTYFNTSAKTSRRLLASLAQNMNVRLEAIGYNSPHLISNFNYMYIAIVVR